MPTARLPDGREVDAASDEWRAHCLAEWQARQPLVDRHVAALKRAVGRQARSDYLAGVARADGQEIVERVVADFGKWFEAEKKRRAELARRST